MARAMHRWPTMRAGWALTAIPALVAACGDNLLVDPDGIESGSRLRAVFTTAGSARQFAGFYDRERDERCTFGLDASHQQAYCVPLAAEATMFLDSACTHPAAERWEDDCAPPPRYVKLGPGLCDPDRIWSVGEPVTRDIVYRIAESGYCMPVAGFSYVWYPAAELISLDELVRADVHIAPGMQRLAETYVRGDDGSRQRIGVFDRQLQTDCRFTENAGQIACAPQVCAWGGRWWDEACQTPLVARIAADWDPSCPCASPSHAEVWSETVPGVTARRIYKVGAGVSSTVYSRGLIDGEEVCSREGVTLLDVYERGDEVSLAGAARWLEGSGRIRRRMLGSEGIGTPDGFRDVDLGVDCAPTVASDGVSRCLPTHGAQAWESSSVGYTDPLCTEAISLASSFSEDGSAPASTIAFTSSFPSLPNCDGSTTFHTLERELLPGELYLMLDACRAVWWDRPRERRYVVGAELPPERFVELLDVID